MSSFYHTLETCDTSMKKFLLLYDQGACSVVNASQHSLASFDYQAHEAMMVEATHALSFLIMFMNRNIEAKNFVREQTGNARKYDVLGIVADMLDVTNETLSTSLREWTPAILRLLGTLTLTLTLTLTQPLPL